MVFFTNMFNIGFKNILNNCNIIKVKCITVNYIPTKTRRQNLCKKTAKYKKTTLKIVLLFCCKTFEL